MQKSLLRYFLRLKQYRNHCSDIHLHMYTCMYMYTRICILGLKQCRNHCSSIFWDETLKYTYTYIYTCIHVCICIRKCILGLKQCRNHCSGIHLYMYTCMSMYRCICILGLKQCRNHCSGIFWDEMLRYTSIHVYMYVYVYVYVFWD